ncbi:MAG TPA: hypothetical protein VK949_00935, partial [Methylotenera sp.]|nr:hypothetical protein [Methylotenera sp.]
KDFSVKENGELKCQMYETLKSNTLLWEQYRAIKKIANHHDVTIYNATSGGALDEFALVNLDDLFINNHE